MKLVTREELAKLPDGTVFTYLPFKEYTGGALNLSNFHGEAFIKIGEAQDGDISSVEIILTKFLHDYEILKMLKGECRDIPPYKPRGMFSPEAPAQFLAFEPQDMMHLVKALTQSFSLEQMNELFATRGE